MFKKKKENQRQEASQKGKGGIRHSQKSNLLLQKELTLQQKHLHKTRRQRGRIGCYWSLGVSEPLGGSWVPLPCGLFAGKATTPLWFSFPHYLMSVVLVKKFFFLISSRMAFPVPETHTGWTCTSRKKLQVEKYNTPRKHE